MDVEAWQVPKCKYNHSVLCRWYLLDALSIANISFTMQSEHIHLWGFIKTFQHNPLLKNLIVRCLWKTVSWNWRCFWDSNSWIRTVARKFSIGGLCFSAGSFGFVQGRAWHSINWQKLNWVIVFHVSIWRGLGLCFGGQAPKPPSPWRRDWVECCASCTTESKELLQSLLLAFALSGWPTARTFCLGLLQKYCFMPGWHPGTRFRSIELKIGSLESEKIISGSLESEKLGSHRSNLGTKYFP